MIIYFLQQTVLLRNVFHFSDVHEKIYTVGSGQMVSHLLWTESMKGTQIPLVRS